MNRPPCHFRRVGRSPPGRYRARRRIAASTCLAFVCLFKLLVWPCLTGGNNDHPFHPVLIIPSMDHPPLHPAQDFQITGRTSRGLPRESKRQLPMAPLLQGAAVPGILGSDKATELLATGVDVLPLTDLVEQPGISIFAAPSEQLGISFTGDSEVPGLTTERGIPLAQTDCQQMEGLCSRKRRLPGMKNGSRHLDGAARIWDSRFPDGCLRGKSENSSRRSSCQYRHYQGNSRDCGSTRRCSGSQRD